MAGVRLCFVRCEIASRSPPVPIILSIPGPLHTYPESVMVYPTPTTSGGGITGVWTPLGSGRVHRAEVAYFLVGAVA
jgi:hypothetical protein